MALTAPFVVRIENTSDHSFVETMNAIRIWLDHRKIEPASFLPAGSARRGRDFEIAFNGEDEARLFEHEFAELTRAAAPPI